MSEYADPTVQDYYGTKRVTAWPAVNFDEKPGYAVRYADGYTSWSPQDVFEKAYQPVTAMGFGGALAALQDGHKVRRAGWHPLWTIDPNAPQLEYFGTLARVTPADMLCTDWTITE